MSETIIEVMNEMTMNRTVIIATKEELEVLFDTEEKQEIFRKILFRIINEILIN